MCVVPELLSRTNCATLIGRVAFHRSPPVKAFRAHAIPGTLVDDGVGDVVTDADHQVTMERSMKRLSIVGVVRSASALGGLRDPRSAQICDQCPRHGTRAPSSSAAHSKIIGGFEIRFSYLESSKSSLRRRALSKNCPAITFFSVSPHHA